MAWRDRVEGFFGRRAGLTDSSHRDQAEPEPAPMVREKPIKSPPMEIDGRVMTADEFVAYVQGLQLQQPLPTRFFLHHTWKPTRETWRGYSTILAMKRHYERQLWRDAHGRLREGWTVGPHLFIADDGIWLFSDLRRDGVGVYGHNYRSRHLEIVGDYDRTLPSGPTLENTIVALGILHEKFGLNVRDLLFHRDFSSKSCPGWALTKEWIIPQVEHWIEEFRRSQEPAPEPEDPLAALTEALMRMVDDLLVEINPETALSMAAKERLLLGALTNEVPMEIEEQGYIIQIFAEALLVPVDRWDEIQSLEEFARARREEPPEEDGRVDEELPEEPVEDDEDVEDVARRTIKAPPTDPYQFTGDVR